MHPSERSLSLAQIRLQNLRAKSPHLFSVTGYPPLDLRKFQSSLFRKQRAERVSGFAQEAAKAAGRIRRLRVRLPLPGACKVQDTGTDAAHSRLYFELSNGQIVRADRGADRQDFNAATGRFRKGRRRHPLNPVLRAIVVAEVELNANRKAA